MKRAFCLFLAVLCALLSGCAGREPDRLSVVRLLSIDRAGEGYAASAFPMEIEAGDRFAVSGCGESTAEALMALTAEESGSAFLGHTEHVVLGESYGEAGIGELLSCAVLGDTLRPDSCLWAALAGSGADWASRSGGDRGAETLNRLTGGGSGEKSVVSVTAAEAKTMLDQNGAVLLPALAPDGAEPAGYAVFSRGMLVGTLDGDASLGAELLLEEPCGQTAEVCGEAVRFMKAKVTVTPLWNGEEFSGVELFCRATVRPGSGKRLSAEEREELELAAAEIVEERVWAAVEALKELDADGTGWKYRALERAFWKADKVETVWPEKLSGLTVRVRTSVQAEQ